MTAHQRLIGQALPMTSFIFFPASILGAEEKGERLKISQKYSGMFGKSHNY